MPFRQLHRAARWSAAALFAVIGAAFAQGLSVDWKYYGGGPVTVTNAYGVDDQTVCFYDAKGITRPGAHIRVWIKCLNQKDVDDVDISKDFDGAILENTARKIASYYVPPFARVES